ncbi:MAG: hypothetical protein NTW16_09995 [Bacteroidetes bacterium]|nr:hypothetical protein [Bacteroidota bacterium]
MQDYLDLLQTQVDKDPAQAAITAKKITQLKAEKKALDDLIASYIELSDNVEENPDMAFERIAGFKPDTEPTRKETPDEEFDRISGGVFDESNTRQETPDEEFDRVSGGAFAEPDTGGALGVDVWGQKAEAFMGYANTVLNGMMGIDSAMSAYENAQLQKDVNVNEEKKKNLKRQLDAKQISQKQYDAGVLKLDTDMEKKKKELQVKQAKRQKALSLVQAIINTAQAVTSALSAGPILGIVLAALVGILGAVQIGYIASTPVPEAMRGRYKAFMKANQAAMGRYDVLGKEDKKQYRGVPFIDSPQSGLYDKPTLFAETGREIILNPKHTENLMKFRPDLVQAIMQVPQRSVGLYPDAGAQKSAASSPVIVQFHPDTLKAMNDFQEQIKKPLGANIVYDDMRNSMATVALLEKSVTR